MSCLARDGGHEDPGRRSGWREEATCDEHDTPGRPIRRQDPRGTTVYFAYGERSERIQMTVLGQGTIYYEYGPALRMELVLDGKTGRATYYEYDGAGKVTVQVHPNGSTTYFAYDGAGRLSEKVTKVDSDGSVLVKFAYTRDAGGNPIAIERESGLGVWRDKPRARSTGELGSRRDNEKGPSGWRPEVLSRSR